MKWPEPPHGYSYTKEDAGAPADAIGRRFETQAEPASVKRQPIGEVPVIARGGK